MQSQNNSPPTLVQMLEINAKAIREKNQMIYRLKIEVEKIKVESESIRQKLNLRQTLF